MADIIDFPTARIKRLILMERARAAVADRQLIVECYKDMVAYGFSAREAAQEALEAAQCH